MTAYKTFAQRSRLPLAVVFVASAVGVVLWSIPGDGFPTIHRVLGTMVLSLLSFTILMMWWIGWSGLPSVVRLGLPILLFALALGCVAKVDWTGDMIPVFRFRWEPSPAELLAAYQEEQAGSPSEESSKLPPYRDDDYPEYRNRARDGVATGPKLSRDWKARPPRLLWKHPCGGGYAGFAVGCGVAVTLEQRGNDEAIVAYEIDTGRERWARSYPAHFYDVRAEGPMATPTMVEDRIYALGATGKLSCVSLHDGYLVWQVDILADNDNLAWGMSGSPLVIDDVVVVNAGRQRGDNHSLVAYATSTGEQRWAVGDTRAGYSSPMRAKLHGVEQILLFDGEELAGYDRTGDKKLWSSPWPTNMGINVAEPVLLPDNRIFISSGYGVGCGVMQIDRHGTDWYAHEAGKTLALRSHFSSPVLFGDLVYGLDEGVLVAVDPTSLQRVWRGARYGKGQILRCDDLILVLSENGELVLVEAKAAQTNELGKLKVLPGNKTWNCPSLAGGKAYIRNHIEMACYDLSE